MNSNQDNSPTVEIGEASFEAEVLKSKQPALVVFGAPWSRPCQMLRPVLDEVATACAGSVKVVRINADDNPGLGVEYEIQSIPTLLYFVDGLERARMVGTVSQEAIRSQMQLVAPGDKATSPISDTNNENEQPKP